MYLSKSPVFRFWVTVYSVPAAVPLVLYLAFDILVSKDLASAMGSAGMTIDSDIRHALFASFVVLAVLANVGALWHVNTGKPGIPHTVAPED